MSQTASIVIIIGFINFDDIFALPMAKSCPSFQDAPGNSIIPGEYIPVYSIITHWPSFLFPEHPPFAFNKFYNHLLFNVSANGYIEKAFRSESSCSEVEYLRINIGNRISLEIFNKSMGIYCTTAFDFEYQYQTLWTDSRDFGIIYGCSPQQRDFRLRDVGLFVLVSAALYRKSNESSYDYWLDLAMDLLRFDDNINRSSLRKVFLISEEDVIYQSTSEVYRKQFDFYCKTLKCKRIGENSSQIVEVLITVVVVGVIIMLCFGITNCLSNVV